MSMPTPPHRPQQPQTPPPGYAPQAPARHNGQPAVPGHGAPPGYAGQPTQQFAAHQAVSKTVQLVWTLGLVSLLAVILGLSLKEDGRNQWDTVHAWGGLAIAGALLTLAPAFGRSIGLTPQRAQQAATCGAGALVLFWVLFTLPSVGSNMSLLTTIGVAAGAIAAWVAPGREPAAPQRQTW